MSDDNPTLYTAVSRTQREMGVRGRERPRREWAEMIVAALLLVLGAFVAIQTATMEVVGDDLPGPRFFPAIIAALFFVTGIGVAVHVVRQVRAADRAETGPIAAESIDSGESAEADETPRTDWRTLGIVLLAFVGFILILPVLGWLLSAAALYWVICTALGAKQHLVTLGVALVFSALAQIAFSLGLGLNLPAGILGGLF